MQDAKVALVALDQAVEQSLDYALPEGMQASVGMRVLVTLRGRECQGTIVELKKTSKFPKLQPVKQLLSEEGLLPDDLLRLAKWMERYYCTSERRVFKMLLPTSVRNEIKPKTQLFIKRLISNAKLSSLCITLRESNPAQAKVLEVILKYPKGILLSQLLEIAQVSRSPVETLITKKVLKQEEVNLSTSPLDKHEFFKTKPKKLTDEQQETYDKIEAGLQGNRFETHLIHGVTGSGKTELYLRAIEAARQQGRSVIMLVPEIALTTQTIERFRFRFTEKMGILHHRLSDGERYEMWHAIRKGEINIVIGARSALLSPVQNLGLIIVDEEHDNSYKQSDEAPCYHARDLAIMRAKLNAAVAILGSATPSIETYANAQKGKYILSTLKTRPAHATLPTVSCVDMKREYEKHGGYTLFSNALLEGIKSRVSKGEQVLLFLNKRGYHSVQMCTSCGNSFKCDSCDVTLTYHRSWECLNCHLCGKTVNPPPRACPHCKSEQHLKFKGVGTEQVERALYAILPTVRIIRMDADTTRHKGSHDRLFKLFRSGKADVLIGTQMIAKGLHFPSVTLVGILNADSALNIPDFRASENVFQLITQVAGRSGRGALEGEVVLQTMNAENPLITHASKEDYLSFFNDEIETRKAFDFPPYSHLAKLTFSGVDETLTFKTALALQQALAKDLPPSFTLYPVIPSGHAKVKDKYRFKLLIKGTSMLTLTPILKRLLTETPPPRAVRLLIDIDPTSTFF